MFHEPINRFMSHNRLSGDSPLGVLEQANQSYEKLVPGVSVCVCVGDK
jgi:hypothetical protein